MVESRWATMKLVFPRIISSKAFWMRISVRVSMLEVASSKISIGGEVSITRAMQSSCFCPWEMLPPSSEMTVSYPWGSRLMKLWAWAALAAAITSSSLASGRA